MPCHNRLIKAVGLWAALSSLLCYSQTPASEPNPGEATQQPIPFSHRLHSSLELDCVVCHPGAEEEASAGLPEVEDCLQCHQSLAIESAAIEKLTELAERNESVEWVRIYQVPYFVFFSHAYHSRAGVACMACHGRVEQQEVLKKEQQMSMLFCVNCHKKERASTECHLCHELSQ